MMDASQQTGSSVLRSLCQSRMVIAAVLGFAIIVASFWAWWPGGLVLGLVCGTCIVAKVGVQMHKAAVTESADLPLMAADGDLAAIWSRVTNARR